MLRSGQLPAERIEAWTGDAAGDATVGRQWDTTLNAKFDKNCTVQKALGLSAGERGCAASHADLWRMCVERNGPVLVLEDDLEFSAQALAAPGGVGATARHLVAALEAGMEPAERTLLLYLGADAYCREGAPSLRGKQAIWAARAAPVSCLLKEAEWAWQTHAYIVWPAAASVLLAGLPIDAPVDVYLSRHFYTRKLCGLVCDPELATQLDPYHGGDVEHSSLADRPSLGPFDNKFRGGGALPAHKQRAFQPRR